MPKPKVKVEKLQKIYEDMKAYVKRYKDEVPPDRPANSKLRVFSDCAGIGSEAIALNLLGLSQQVTLVGGSEADEKKRIMMETVHEKCLVETGPPEAFSKDIFKRQPENCPACDIYLAGYPCPAFSSLGNRFGLRDGKKRGLPMVAGLRYIVRKKPAIVVLEQVTGWLHKNHEKARTMLRKTLAACHYTTRIKVLNTSEHGLPQSRRRAYLVALRNPDSQFRFPKKLPWCPPLETCLNVNRTGEQRMDLQKFGSTSETSKVWEDYWVLDVGCSAKFSSIPNARASQKPGVPRPVCKAMLQTLNQEHAHMKRLDKARCETVVASALGDSMSVNVLMRVLQRAIVASGLWPSMVPMEEDFWKSRSAAADLNTLYAKTAQIAVGTAGRLPAPDRSGHCRASSASSRSQWALHLPAPDRSGMPDFICQLQIAVGTTGLWPHCQITVGPQRLPDRSGHRRTAAATARSQWALQDFSRDGQIGMGIAGLQTVYMQIDCQMAQLECQT
eukprot:s501_g26.t1